MDHAAARPVKPETMPTRPETMEDQDIAEDFPQIVFKYFEEEISEALAEVDASIRGDQGNGKARRHRKGAQEA